MRGNHVPPVTEFEPVELDIAHSAAALEEAWVDAIALFDELFPGGQQTLNGSIDVLDVADVDLPDQQRLVAGGRKPAAIADQRCRHRQAGDDRRLFDHHRHEMLAPVHDEIRRDCQGQ